MQAQVQKFRRHFWALEHFSNLGQNGIERLKSSTFRLEVIRQCSRALVQAFEKLRDERKFKFDRVALIFRSSLNEYIIQAMIAIAYGVS